MGKKVAVELRFHLIAVRDLPEPGQGAIDGADGGGGKSKKKDKKKDKDAAASASASASAEPQHESSAGRVVWVAGHVVAGGRSTPPPAARFQSGLAPVSRGAAEAEWPPVEYDDDGSDDDDDDEAKQPFPHAVRTMVEVDGKGGKLSSRKKLALSLWAAPRRRASSSSSSSSSGSRRSKRALKAEAEAEADGGSGGEAPQKAAGGPESKVGQVSLALSALPGADGAESRQSLEFAVPGAKKGSAGSTSTVQLKITVHHLTGEHARGLDTGATATMQGTMIDDVGDHDDDDGGGAAAKGKDKGGKGKGKDKDKGKGKDKGGAAAAAGGGAGAGAGAAAAEEQARLAAQQVEGFRARIADLEKDNARIEKRAARQAEQLKTEKARADAAEAKLAEAGGASGADAADDGDKKKTGDGDDDATPAANGSAEDDAKKDLEAQIAKLEEDLAAARAENEKERKRRTKSERNLKALRVAGEEADADSKSAEAALDSKKRQIEELEADVDKLEESLADEVKKRKALEAAAADGGSDLEKAVADKEKEIKRRRSAEKKVSEAEAATAAAKEELAAAAAKAEEELAAAKAAADEAAEVAAAELEKEAAAATEAKADLEKERKRRKRAEKDVARLGDELKAAQAEAAAAAEGGDAQEAASAAALKEARASLEEVRAQLSKAEAARDDASAKRKTEHEARERAEARAAAAEEKAAAAAEAEAEATAAAAAATAAAEAAAASSSSASSSSADALKSKLEKASRARKKAEKARDEAEARAEAAESNAALAEAKAAAAVAKAEDDQGAAAAAAVAAAAAAAAEGGKGEEEEDRGGAALQALARTLIVDGVLRVSHLEGGAKQAGAALAKAVLEDAPSDCRLPLLFDGVPGGDPDAADAEPLSVVSAVRFVVERASRDEEQLLFWLVFVLSMGEAAHAASEKKKAEGQAAAERLWHKSQKLVGRAFTLLLLCLCEKVENSLAGALLTNASEKRKAAAKSGGSKRGAAAAAAGAAYAAAASAAPLPPIRPPRVFAAALVDFAVAAHRAELSPELTELIVGRVLTFADVQILEAVLERAAGGFCAAGTGFELKMALSAHLDPALATSGLKPSADMLGELQEDLGDDGAEAAVKEAAARVSAAVSSFDASGGVLPRTRELANFLAMDKSLAADEETAKEIFPLLNPAQMAHVAEHFAPDELAPAAVDADVVAALKKRAGGHELMPNSVGPDVIDMDKDLLDKMM